MNLGDIAPRPVHVAGAGASHGAERQDVVGQEPGRAQAFAIGREAAQQSVRIVVALRHHGAQVGVIDGQALHACARRQPSVHGEQPFGQGLVADLNRHAGQIIDGVKVGPGVGRVAVVHLEPTEGVGGAADVVQLHQADAGHLPQARARRVGEGVVLGDQAHGVVEQVQPFAEAVLVHQGQGVDAGGVGPDEPVGFRPGDLFHRDGGGVLARVVADGQGVEMGDLRIARVTLPPGGGGKLQVPPGRALEIALIQIGPDDMIEPVQPLPAGRAQSGLTEGLELGEGRGPGAAFDCGGQCHRVAMRRVRGSGEGRRGCHHGDAEPERPQK